MAPRGRKSMTSDVADRSYDSSPDPLALSVNETPAKSTRTTTPRKPFSETSPSKQNRRLSISEMDLMSPSKSIVMNTPRTGNASPWRIRVTVQAEPGSEDHDNNISPSYERVTRTQTTTVPLKDPDAPLPIKRGRGRPRKSDVVPATKPKRSGTPKKKARSKSRDQSMGAAEASAADVDTDAPQKKRRGRPRKSLPLPIEDDDFVVVEDVQTEVAPNPETTPTPPADIEPASEESAPAMTEVEQTNVESALPAPRRRRRFLPEYEMPVVDTPPQTELGDRLRARKGTPHAKRVVSIPISSDNETDHESDVLTPTSGEEDGGQVEAERDIFPSITVEAAEYRHQAPSVQQNNPEPEAHAPEDDEERVVSEQLFEDDQEELQDATNFAFDEGATRMPDDTTVLDSENFSMISVDSLPSSGGLTSPPKAEEVRNNTPSIASSLRHEHLRPSPRYPSPQIPRHSNSPLNPTNASTSLAPPDASSRPAMRRYVTPIIDSEVPSAPPAIEPAQPTMPKTETPKLGRVVTAGVALQGLLGPSRLTPEQSQNIAAGKFDGLDDLFRGFSTGTRKDLQAGFRLGEQLASSDKQGQSTPVQSSPIRVQPTIASKPSSSKTERKYDQSRLLTPEESDDPVITPTIQTDVNNVQYPALNVAEAENSLISPARSEDEMSWQVDTPPVTNSKTDRVCQPSVAAQSEVQPMEVSATAQANKPVQHDDYADIWQEEASRSSNSMDTEDAPQELDVFETGPIQPPRGKLPRTWRRTSGAPFQYSDEAESPQQLTPPREESVEVPKAGPVEMTIAEAEEMDNESDASDDTGMFFQSNMPNIFNHRRSRDMKQKKAEKLDLSLLLKEGESHVPDSSPPVAARKAPKATINPFLDTPPQFAGILNSPSKSSPLRREIRGSDLSSSSPVRVGDESSLPLAQSSPFHTYVDGQSMMSVASDQRQLQMEMGNVTDSSIRRVRDEADEYLEAYEPQERSLDGITEITEPSRTWHQQTNFVASSPPQMKMLSPIRKRVPLFGTPDKPQASQQPSVAEEETSAGAEMKRDAFVVEPTEEPQQSSGRPMISRMTSTLWSAVSGVAPAELPKPHPILSKLTHLPKVEPWTKTHYKTLDKLYNIHRKHPALFSPSITPANSLSKTNAHLLQKFLETTKKPYVGATFSAWGYELDMSEELITICAVYMELMSLGSIKEYETIKGRAIEMGDCGPGRAGDLITGEEVVRRLATVILGDEVRRDEKKGVKIDRSESLEVEWPQ